jgi:hypothetical protein
LPSRLKGSRPYKEVGLHRLPLSEEESRSCYKALWEEGVVVVLVLMLNEGMNSAEEQRERLVQEGVEEGAVEGLDWSKEVLVREGEVQDEMAE